MSEKKSKIPEKNLKIDSPDELNAGNPFMDTTIHFLHIFGEFPDLRLRFKNVSLEFLDYLIDEKGFSIEKHEPSPSLRFNKDSYEKKIGDTKPTVRNLYKMLGTNTMALSHSDIGIIEAVGFNHGEVDGVDWGNINFYAFDNESAHELVQKLREDYLNPAIEGIPFVHVIKQNCNGTFETKAFQINKKDIDLDTYYEKSESLKTLNESIIDNVNNSDKSFQSFYIFHGKYGTGKTSYIRYLMTEFKKPVIYVPPHMVQIIADPKFVDFMADNANSVLVIEDAEDVVEDKGERDNALANLLNLTDGILGDCFNMDIICTFNTNINNIDEALVRNGRLNGMFKFEELSYEKAKVLCDQQGIEVPEEKTLANIFGNKESDVDTDTDLIPRKPIGFASSNGKSNKNGKATVKK